ncbi:hypothetical protein AcW1_006824 [Taiwanofungus camphoratus]|nr:hypothetical protein AcW1_006824 [Antrodia cinnamomea]
MCPSRRDTGHPIPLPSRIHMSAGRTRASSRAPFLVSSARPKEANSGGEEGRADPATVLHEPKRSLVQPKAAVGIYLLRDTSDSFYDSRGDYKHDSLARRAPRWNGRLGTTHKGLARLQDEHEQIPDACGRAWT